VSYGPDNFPQGYNPLSGQPVSDPARLEDPAILLSMSHFPPEARPQAGFSFMPFVYEYYITEGSTRHLGVVYGEFPEPEIPLRGDCEVRAEPMTQTDLLLGNRVWHDKNDNGVQDPREGGIGGICVNLLDETGKVLQQTTTDSNGYFAFNVEAGRYTIEFQKPDGLEFTEKNVRAESTDSDVDPDSGYMDVIEVSNSSQLFWDAGLVSSSNITPTPDASVEMPVAQVGPIRSGRIFYKYMGAMYQDSCLIYASADPAVLREIPGCATVAHTVTGGGAMLPLERMARISEQNRIQISITRAICSPKKSPPAANRSRSCANIGRCSINQSGRTTRPLSPGGAMSTSRIPRRQERFILWLTGLMADNCNSKISF
jgi:hypothetical protein